MKKLYALLITFLIGVACTLSACGSPYQKMKMELITDSSIEIQLTENVEVNTPDGELDPNTAEVKVKISGVGEKISKEAVFTSSDTSKLYVKSTTLDGDTTTAEIIAKKPGNVELYVNSKEGGKKLTVKVSIVRKVSALSFEKNYKPAVVIGGTPTKIDVTKICQSRKRQPILSAFVFLQCSKKARKCLPKSTLQFCQESTLNKSLSMARSMKAISLWKTLCDG